MYGELVDFDVILLFRLLRIICNFIFFVIGWDVLLINLDYSLVVDLVRIKYYCNLVYGYGNIEIIDDFEFLLLW